MSTHQAPLQIYTASVLPAWLDYNNHMNEGYYGVVFGEASDALLFYMGFSQEYRLQSGGSFYTVQAHINFIRELKLGAPLRFETLLLGADAKRLHYVHSMFHADEGYLAATQEGMMLHVEQAEGRVSPMSAELEAVARDVAAAHTRLSVPMQVGRTIRAVPKD